MKFLRDPYYLAFILAFAGYGVLQLVFGQLDLVLFINQFHFQGGDLFFSIVTYLGDGYLVIGLAVLLMFYNREMGVMTLVSYLISSGFTQLLKRTVFSHIHRPLWHLEEMRISGVRIPDGAEIVYNNSFPSGHSTTVFALFTILALFTTRTDLKLMYLLVAVISAFSRVYLLQHFPVDTLAGSFIGVFFATMLFHLIYRTGKLNFLNKIKSGD